MACEEGTVACGKGTWDQGVGPISNQKDAESKAGTYIRKNPHLKWTGAWKTTEDGVMSVINVQLKPLEGSTKTNREVKSIDEIKPGDHCFVKRPAYDHHFIVIEIEKDGKKGTLHVIEYNNSGGVVAGASGYSSGGLKGKVQAGTIKFPENEIFKVEYSKCHKANDTIMAAKNLLGLAEYNLYWGNCEHFATACKNGAWQSDQSDYWLDVPVLGQLIKAFQYLKSFFN